MNKFIQAVSQHDSRTSNDALTNSTSLNNVVDMFFLAGASRTMSEESIISVFVKAYTTNPLLAIKCLFWARDCRGGAGEKRFFRIIMQYLGIPGNYPHMMDELMIHVPTYGSWKDVLLIEKPNSNNLGWISNHLTEKEDGLLAKWLPRHGMWFEALRKHMKYTPKQLRKLLVTMTKVVETKMCARDWDDIQYSSVPSKAFNIYKEAFERHSPDRFSLFIENVKDGVDTIHSGQLFPYELYQSFISGKSKDVINEQWKALPDYVGEGSFIPVCDVSGSMTEPKMLPMSISVSLGVYLSERNKGIFKDAFITFTNTPQMHYLQGTACERFTQLQGAQWGMNTNLIAVFELILTNARRANLVQEDMPNTIIIISDMEFDLANSGSTNFEHIISLYNQSGYIIPKIVFWNVNGRQGNVPVAANQRDVALVSGASPSIMKSVLAGEDFTPVGIMMETLMGERYKAIEIE